MNSSVHGFHYLTRRPVRITWDTRGITTMLEDSDEPPGDLWIAPSLVDLQINGYARIDFQQDITSAEQLLGAVRALRRDGCGHFLLTLITDDWSRLLARLRRLKLLRDASAELRAAIIGWHIEGPFLSEEPGYCGAHNPAHMRDATLDDIRELRSVTGDDRVLLTIAPERAHALEAIRLATSLGLRVSLGHTNASAEMLKEAVAAGATAFTHLGNGCPRELDRHDNILFRACDTAGLTVSFIADGIHVPARAFRLLHKLIAGPVYYTTDAMAAAGAGPGRYRLGELELEVGADQIVRQPGKSNFAGSALTPIDGVFRAAEILNLPWQECWRRFSEVPAHLMGFPNELREGASSFCLIEPAKKSATVILTHS